MNEGLVEADRDLEDILTLQRASRAPTSDGSVAVAPAYRAAPDDWAIIAWRWR
jgi:hypothetical protein